MQEVKNSFVLYWKITKSKKITLSLLLLTLFYNVYFFYFYIVGDQDPAESLVKSSFIVQGGILASIMIGVYLSNLERKVGLEELIDTISHAKTKKNIGKVVFLLSFLTLYLLVNILTLIIMFIFTDVPFSPFYLQSILYVLLYWGFSFVIGALIGMVLAMWIKGRMIYVISLIIWLLISPLNYPILAQLAILLNSPRIFDLINFLNIGQHDPNQPYYIFYGFSLENYQWLKRSFFTLVLLVVMVGSLLIKRKGGKRYISIFIVLVLLASYTGGDLLFGKHQVLRGGSAKDGVLNQDSRYYEELILGETHFNNYQITNYDIDLDIQNYLKAEVVVEIINPTINEMNTFDFLLYHDLEVSEVLDKNGNEFEFNQNRDVVQVMTKNPVVPNEIVQLTFKYEGISSPFFFANHRAINLLNHFPWLPTNSTFDSAMTMTTVGLEVFRLPNQSNQEISYQVKLKGNSNIFSNLQKVNKNEWEGTSSDGIYLVTGSIGEKEINGKSVIYPYTWEKMLIGFPSFEQFIQGKINQINEELQLEREIDMNRYMFIDHALNSEMPEQQIWIYGDSFIISPAGFLFNDELGLEINIDSMTYGIVPAMTWKYDGLFTNDMTELRLFDIAYSYFLNIRGSEEDKKKYNNIEYFDIVQNQDAELAPEATKLKSFIEDTDISEEKKIIFFREWYQDIKNEG